MKQEDIKKSVFSPDISQFLYNIFNKLYKFWGPQHWWPAETKFEMVIGAILAQNISWNSAEKAICNLKRANILSVEGILQTPDEKLAELIKPAGYYNQKAKRLKEFCNFLKREFNSDLEKLFALDISSLRQVLLSQKGIGFETADSIILYGAEKPIFVVDSYTKRLFYRLGLIESEKVKYEDVQNLVMQNLELDTNTFNEFHALIVKHCKEICKSKRPTCKNCCLSMFCIYSSQCLN